MKNCRSLPKGLEELPTTLDIEELDKLARCIDRGFGKQEIAEVAGVVDEVKVDQTRVSRFPVATKAGSFRLQDASRASRNVARFAI